ncbi:MAG TPA: hypothetical protein VG889_17315 [Rhizomicrobium sp.]|nr:hypothetical protein [Rhizomicrobium sp.]
MKLPLLAAVCACALGGCSFTDAATLQDAEKALTIAHLAYQAAGVALEDAAKSGALHGDDAAKAQALYDKAGDALVLADEADAAANADGVLEEAAAAQALIADLDKLTH